MNLFRTSNRARIDPTGTQAPPRILVQNPGTDIMQMAIREDPHVEEGHLERLRAQLEAHQRRNERLNRAFANPPALSAPDQELETLLANLATQSIGLYDNWIDLPRIYQQNQVRLQVYQENQIQRNIDRRINLDRNVQDVTVETRGPESEEMSNLGYHI